MTQTGEIVLKNLLTTALELNAEAIEIEYQNGREEIFAIQGNTGNCIATLDSSAEETIALRKFILNIRKNGMTMEVGGKSIKLAVSIRDSFGEDAYKVSITNLLHL